MECRSTKFWVMVLASAAVWVTLMGAGLVHAANSPPIAAAWNITASGTAASSGELLFRVSDQERDDSIEVTVFVLSGSNETGVASSIRRALNAQLDDQRFDIAGGEGANVLLSSDRNDRFSLELIGSDVDDVRVMVSSAAPAPSPTVPPQRLPANPPAAPATPAAPGDATPPPGPGEAAPSAPPASPSAPPASSSAPPASSSAPPAESSGPADNEASAPPAEPSAPPGGSSPANGGAGAAASAPPPPPGMGSGG
jgi:hypothetical protein